MVNSLQLATSCCYQNDGRFIRFSTRPEEDLDMVLTDWQIYTKTVKLFVLDFYGRWKSVTQNPIVSLCLSKLRNKANSGNKYPMAHVCQKDVLYAVT